MIIFFSIAILFLSGMAWQLYWDNRRLRQLNTIERKNAGYWKKCCDEARADRNDCYRSKVSAKKELLAAQKEIKAAHDKLKNREENYWHIPKRLPTFPNPY